jgi:uncharacterized protein (TIGR03083 family)
MSHAEHRAALRVQVDGFLALLSGADPATPVPTCPGWDLAALAGHVGATHRWVTAMVSVGAAERLSFRPFGAAVPADPAALPGWVAEGAADLDDALAAAPPERPMWAWGADQHARFWSRRMWHELAVHRADAALALDAPLDIGTATGVDGVDEFLTNLPYARWNTAIHELDGDPGSLALHATDAGTTWSVDVGTRAWRRAGSAPRADVAVAGPAAELYLFLWGRVRPAGITGDADLLARWSAATAL